MKIEIKSRYGADVLFTHDCADNTIRVTCEAATKSGADLCGADLRGADLRGADLGGANLYGADLRGAYLGGANLGGANLRGADLRGAYLRGAYLRGAYLRGAYLRGADLRDAYLRGAYLRGANLRGADLGGANLYGAKVENGTLVGDRPVLQIGPIGSRADYLVAFIADTGLHICAGCFAGTLSEFSAAVDKTHGDSVHATEYWAAVAMIKAHAALWTPQVAHQDSESAIPNPLGDANRTEVL